MRGAWCSLPFVVKMVLSPQAPTFCAKIDAEKQDLAFELLREHIPSVPELWEQVGPLSQDDLRYTSANAKPTMTGDDGIPYSAWDCVQGAETLQRCAFALFTGIFFTLEWNNNVAAFLPKVFQDLDDTGEII